MIEVFSSGGGTQSACIAAMIVLGELPKPDFVVIADTGYECASTWQYLDDVVRPALASVGVEVHRIGPEWKIVPEHGLDFTGPDIQTLLMPFYTNQSGVTGKFSGFCSSKWKVNVINRFLSQRFGLTRSKFRKWIGFSLDEWRRTQRMMVREEYRKGLIYFPLVQAVPLRRHQAVQRVVRLGWPTPPRSRCWHCPNQHDDEWLSLPPEEFASAVAFEEEIHKIDPCAFLHRKCVPLSQVDFSREPFLFDAGNYCSSGACFV